ncbi:MAG: hypothetical protein RIR44_1036, partial [Bacteroidota bacterium]
MMANQYLNILHYRPIFCVLCGVDKKVVKTAK